MPTKLECVILIGLPAAGKTTLYRERFARTHAHVSKDLWPKATGRAARQQKTIDELLAAGSSVVVDNTNPSAQERAALIRVARAHDACVIGYFFDLTTRVAVARNADRAGRDKVPNVAIFTAAKRLERPSLAEGFDQLFRVEVSKDREFHITELGR